MAEEFQCEDVSQGDESGRGGRGLRGDGQRLTLGAALLATHTVYASNARQPETVDDFLRNFLLHAGMTQTLQCFQAEWSEMEHRVGVVPDVYTDNQRLDTELKHEYRRAATAAAQALVKTQRSRDLHRLQYTRRVDRGREEARYRR
nr:PREDICTED: sperm-associated antigen 16 protein-like [Paralichthys olivaceus]